MAIPILVVDDAPGIRQLLTDILEDIGYEVLPARDGQDALTIVEDHPGVGLIVTDIDMPILDGRGLCRALARRGKVAPVVVMSASNAREIARELGAIGYLDKPFTVFQARATIEAALRGAGAEQTGFVPEPQERALRVFILTSQRFLAQMIRMTLNHGVYVTRAAQTMEDAATIVRDWRPHLAVIDLDSRGEEFLRLIEPDQANGATRLPLLAVTRNRSLKTMLTAFNLGVDDVMTVPISPEELLARVLAITRRTFGQIFPMKPVVVLGDLEIDIVNHRVRMGSSEAHLTETEQSLLYLLAANTGEVLSESEILDTIWGIDYPSDAEMVDRHVVSLRAKLQDGATEPRYIVTIADRGYRFEPAVVNLAAT